MKRMKKRIQNLQKKHTELRPHPRNQPELCYKDRGNPKSVHEYKRNRSQTYIASQTKPNETTRNLMREIEREIDSWARCPALSGCTPGSSWRWNPSWENITPLFQVITLIITPQGWWFSWCWQAHSSSSCSSLRDGLVRGRMTILQPLLVPLLHLITPRQVLVWARASSSVSASFDPFFEPPFEQKDQLTKKSFVVSLSSIVYSFFHTPWGQPFHSEASWGPSDDAE